MSPSCHILIHYSFISFIFNCPARIGHMKDTKSGQMQGSIQKLGGVVPQNLLMDGEFHSYLGS